jgi:hypothetical protein
MNMADALMMCMCMVKFQHTDPVDHEGCQGTLWVNAEQGEEGMKNDE